MTSAISRCTTSTSAKCHDRERKQEELLAKYYASHPNAPKGGPTPISESELGPPLPAFDQNLYFETVRSLLADKIGFFEAVMRAGPPDLQPPRWGPLENLKITDGTAIGRSKETTYHIESAPWPETNERSEHQLPTYQVSQGRRFVVDRQAWRLASLPPSGSLGLNTRPSCDFPPSFNSASTLVSPFRGSVAQAAPETQLSRWPSVPPAAGKSSPWQRPGPVARRRIRTPSTLGRYENRPRSAQILRPGNPKAGGPLSHSKRARATIA